MLKDFSIIFNGLLCIQLINFGLFFIYPFLYPDEGFAFYGLIVSTVLILTSFINLKMNNLVMIVRSDKEESDVIYCGIKIALIFSIFILIIISLFFSEFYLLCIGICLLGMGVRQPIETWLNKKGKYKLLISLQLSQVLIAGISSLFFILISHNVYGLVYGYTIGIVFSSIFCLFVYKLSFRELFHSSIFQNLRKYWKFNSFVSLSSLINTFSRNSVVYVLTYFFPASVVGQFVYVQKILQVPVSIYTQPLSKIYYRESSLLGQKKLKKLTHSILSMSAFIGLLFLVFVFLGSDYFNQVFGHNWDEAPVILRYLSIWIFITILSEPLSSFLEVRYKVVEKLVYNVFLLIVRTGSIILSGYFLTFSETILVFSLAGAFCNLILLIYILKEINLEVEN